MTISPVKAARVLRDAMRTEGLLFIPGVSDKGTSKDARLARAAVRAVVDSTDPLLDMLRRAELWVSTQPDNAAMKAAIRECVDGFEDSRRADQA